jgi:hypothetical protein
MFRVAYFLLSQKSSLFSDYYRTIRKAHSQGIYSSSAAANAGDENMDFVEQRKVFQRMGLRMFVKRSQKKKKDRRISEHHFHFIFV